MRRMGRLGAVAVALWCFSAGCTAMRSQTTITVPEVEQKIDRLLPVGSTRHDVEEWLEAEKLEFSYSEQLSWCSELRHLPNKESYRGFIVSIIRDTDRSLFVTGDIQVYFLFDSEGRFAKRLVSWVGTGL